MFFGSSTLVHRTYAYALARLSPSRSRPFPRLLHTTHRPPTGTATILLDSLLRRMQLSESLDTLFSADVQLQ